MQFLKITQCFPCVLQAIKVSFMTFKLENPSQLTMLDTSRTRVQRLVDTGESWNEETGDSAILSSLLKMVVMIFDSIKKNNDKGCFVRLSAHHTQCPTLTPWFAMASWLSNKELRLANGMFQGLGLTRYLGFCPFHLVHHLIYCRHPDVASGIKENIILQNVQLEKEFGIAQRFGGQLQHP